MLTMILADFSDWAQIADHADYTDGNTDRSTDYRLRRKRRSEIDVRKL